MTTPTDPTSSTSKSTPHREWMPRMWQGCNLTAWLRLLLRNRFAVQPPFWYIAGIVTGVSVMHSVLSFVQNAWYGGKIARTIIRHAPLFIIGHWRTGTTLLHELLILDERHNYPNTYECLEPNHFLVTERLFTRLLPFLMPSHRPMDNMAAGWDRPQEDEFALCMMGQPSPYLTIAFPNHLPQDQEAFDLERLPARNRDAWKHAFLRYLRTLTFKDPRRLILKSPTHSLRIKVLLELFPDARFVHIVRDPYVVFASTINLWKSLYNTHGLQRPTFDGLEEQVFNTFTRLYAKLEEDIRFIPSGRFHELRYEDLVREPIAEMKHLYERLELNGFERVLSRLKHYREANAGYQTNRYNPPSPELQAAIEERWGKVIRQYGYEKTTLAAT